MNATELRKLPATIPLWPTAGQALGISRTKTYQLARDGQFPTRVLKLGRTHQVITSELLKFLGVDQVA